MMKTCGSCQHPNPDEARYCQQCGAQLDDQPSTVPQDLDESRLWRAFIGPNAERYLEQFRKFTAEGGVRYALNWNWPAFLFDPFLWFLYRKMYLYAAVYAIGPVVSAFLTGDVTVGIVWRVVAGASANYIYYWHVREQLGRVQRTAGLEPQARERLLEDLGGVQPYVVWLGVLLHAVLLVLVVGAILQGPPEGGRSSPPESSPGRRGE